MSKYSHLRRVRALMDAIEVPHRKELVKELLSADESGAGIKDLVNILEEDCGYWSWGRQV